MIRKHSLWGIFLLVAVWLAVPQLMAGAGAAEEYKQLIFDEAGLLTAEESAYLNTLANELGAERETDFIIYTSNNEANTDVLIMMQNFYDERAPGYDKPHGNAAILALDMRNREIQLGGFYLAEDYLDDGRMDKIRNHITPDLSNGDYGLAFEKFIETAHRYMGFEPGVNPDNILFKLWFQLLVAFGIGGTVVGTMAYNSGGRVTVQRQTYEDARNSGVLDKRDQYLRTTVTKKKIERSSGGGSGGGGGGVTGGGHSHSGSRGSF